MSRATARLGATAIAAALLALLAVFASGDYQADAHPTVHAQKKLFSGRWYKPSADLTTSPPWLGVPEFTNAQCDGGYDTPSCVSKWQGPAYASYADWNNQPSTARFNLQSYRDHNWDNNTYIVDTVQAAPPGLLGFAAFYDYGGYQCSPYFYSGVSNYCSVYRWSDAIIIDDNHTGAFSTPQSRQATITHELGHVLSLAHESTNESGSPPYPLYPCRQDDTGVIPASVMAYDCIEPTGYPYYGAGIYTVQDWDTCGVNHAYPDPAYEWEECECYPPPAGAGPPSGPPGFYHPLTPTRILDTRPAPFGPIGGTAGRVGPGCVISVQVAGVGGVPASGVSAVVVNATVTEPTTGGYITLYPSGASLPLASNLNFGAGQTIPNLVTVKVGPDGKVNIFNKHGQTHVVLDVAGWYDSTPDVGPDVIGIDTNTAGNTATSVGTIEPCVEASPGSTVTVDLFAANIQPFYNGGTQANQGDDFGGMIGWNAALQYNETPLTITNENQNFLLKSGASSSPFSLSDPVADTDGNNTWLSSSLDTGGGIPESGSGVLSRLTIAVDVAAPLGQYTLTLDPTGTVIVDAGNNAVGPDSLGHAAIAVNRPCGVIVGPGVGSPGVTPLEFGYYHPVAPARILDTRNSPQGSPAGAIGPDGTILVQVAGAPGSNVPATGVTAVVLNATVTQATLGGYVTLFPSNVSSAPLASNLNFSAGETAANLVIVKVGPDGKVKAFNKQGSTHLVLDVAGWFGVQQGTDPTLFRSLNPVRILDSRSGPQGSPAGKLLANTTVSVQVAGVGGVPAGVKAVVLNATVTEPLSTSYLTVYPSDVPRPLASNLNFGAGETVPNLVIVKVGANGRVNAYTCCGDTHLVFDVAGWFGP